MRNTLMAIILATSISAPAFASDWWLVSVGGKIPTAVIVFVDKASIRDMGGMRKRAWSGLYFGAHKGGVYTSKTLSEYNCADRTTTVLSYIDYGFDDGIVGQNTYTEYTKKAIPTAPDTIGEAQLMFSCGEPGDYSQVGSIDSLREFGTKLETPASPKPHLPTRR